MKSIISSIFSFGAGKWREFALLAALAAIAFIAHAWLAARDAVAQAKATVAAQSQLIAQQKQQYAALSAQIAARDSAAQAQIQSMQAQVAQLKTAAQIAAWLPKQISLPEPVTITLPQQNVSAPPPNHSKKSVSIANARAPAGNSPASKSLPAVAGNSPSTKNGLASSPNAEASIPQADLPALRDYVESCKVCQLNLRTSQQDLAAKDQQLQLAAAQLSAMQKARDAALRAAKGGSFWNRLKHDAKLIFFVSASTAGALCASGHCK